MGDNIYVISSNKYTVTELLVLMKVCVFFMFILVFYKKKNLCGARPKMQNVFKFSDVLFALKSDGPPIVEVSGWLTFLSDLWLRLTFGQMYPPLDILWPNLELLQVRLTFGQMYPQQRHPVAKFGTTSG